MAQQFPTEISQRIATWVHENSTDRKAEASDLSEAYRKGAPSSAVSLAAYLTTRMPATFAAISAVLDQVQLVAPHFTPTTIIDIGSGPGTASIAALGAWPSLTDITMVEADKRFAALAAALLPQAKLLQQPFLQAHLSAELVIAAYVFAELPEAQASVSALHVWQQAQTMLIIIEPGTPKGFARIREARAALIKAGANIVGPCTHHNDCPMQGGDWCHFKTRLSRSRAHMQAKSATVPFEDESFSWVAVSRQPLPLSKFRILAPPLANKVAVIFKLCGAEGVSQTAIASRDKPAYKLARKKKWGDSLDV